MIERALGHVEGIEKLVVSRAVQILYPRVEQRIRRASEEDLRAELKYLHELTGAILQEAPQRRSSRVSPKLKRRKIRS